MADQYIQGIQLTSDNRDQIRNDISVVSTNWFVNRCPLTTRLPRVPVASTTFTMVTRGHRPRILRLADELDLVATRLELEDPSSLMVGDVLELPSGERVEVEQGQQPNGTNVTVIRGVEGTTIATGSSGQELMLIGNSRTGAEVDQPAVAIKPVGVAQYCQTWQHPVQIGGSLQASLGFQTTPGISSPFEQSKMDALQNLVDDMEVSTYYGIGEAPTGSNSSRPKQKGLRSLLVTNRTVAPNNATSYTPSDLVHDTLERCRANGGAPDVLVVSTNFMTGLAIWGHAAQRIDAGVNVFGVPIDIFEAPFLGGVSIIEAPLLKPFTAICLTSSEVRLRMKRNEFWNPRGSRGDAIEGDWIAEGAIEVENESHHAWLEGISAFSAT